jgi:hypothetical protein
VQKVVKLICSLHGMAWHAMQRAMPTYGPAALGEPLLFVAIDCYLQVHPSMARELFAAGFVSCWSELDNALQEQLVRSLEVGFVEAKSGLRKVQPMLGWQRQGKGPAPALVRVPYTCRADVSQTHQGV